jgi:hypothetical protein
MQDDGVLERLWLDRERAAADWQRDCYLDYRRQTKKRKCLWRLQKPSLIPNAFHIQTLAAPFASWTILLG